MRKYGELPEVIRKIETSCNEIMRYQYMPIVIPGHGISKLEPRLEWVDELISEAINDHLSNLKDTEDMYIYLTVKHGWQDQNVSLNRKGWHSDGFMTEDINYIWYDCMPTVFCEGPFELDQDDVLSLDQMREQSMNWNLKEYPNKTLLRLDQYNIHRVNSFHNLKGMRTFVKISFSKDRYNLIGNTHNYAMDYNWEMAPRKEGRNIPQSKPKS
jgi:hypothetical protein